MKPDENERLIDDLLEGEISESDFLKLEAELIVSTEAREAYYDRLKLHTGLQEEARASDPGSAPSAISIKPEKRKLDPILLGAIGALALLVAVLGWKIIEDTQAQQGEPIASGFGVVADLANAKWETGLALSRGDLVPDRAVTLEQGRAQLELFNGIVLVFEGGSTFTLISETGLQLERGRMQVLIPEVATAFEVTVPSGRIEGAGPEFAVEIREESTLVEVVSGTAEWIPEFGEPLVIVEKDTLLWKSSRDFENSTSTGISMRDLEAGFDRERLSRLKSWSEHRAQLLRDPAMLAWYAMQPTEEGNSSLHDLAGENSVETVVLADHASDRWNRSRSALDFSPMGSRVRVTIPGEHQSLTLMCWVKIDSLDRLYNSLFLTDGHELHEPHWQIMNDGRLFFSVRANDAGKGKDKYIAYSPPIWSPARSGQWMHLSTVYDGEAFTITHYINGKAVSMDPIPESLYPEKVTIGPASIGNWSEPRYRKDAEFAVRNLNGTIDELGLWSRPLAAGEIEKIWEKGKP